MLAITKIPILAGSIFVIIFIFIVFVSCEKDDSRPQGIIYDTIKPGNYLPVYPGTWWRYLVDDTIIVIDSVSTEYKLHSYKNSPDYIYDEDGDLIITYTDSVYVPFLNSQPVYGYFKIERIEPPFGNYYTKWPILSETVGFKFERNWEDKRFGDFSEKVEIKNKIFNGVDSALILEGHWIYGPNVANKSYQEYIKGIGLVKELIIDTVTTDTLYNQELIEYFVND